MYGMGTAVQCTCTDSYRTWILQRIRVILSALRRDTRDSARGRVREEGTLFPGGKNQNIDAMIDSTIASIPADTPEDFVPSETDEVANWMLDLFAAEPGAIEAVEGCD